MRPELSRSYGRAVWTFVGSVSDTMRQMDALLDATTVSVGALGFKSQTRMSRVRAVELALKRGDITL